MDEFFLGGGQYLQGMVVIGIVGAAAFAGSKSLLLLFELMSKYEIPFISLCIREFGNRFHVGRAAAYEYLRTYQGLQFLIQFYDVEHLQSIEDTVDDLVLWCNKNGGGLS